jgi:hypothetical protein
MIKEQIARTLLRPTDTLQPNGALAADVIVDPDGGLAASSVGLAIVLGAGDETGRLAPFGSPAPHTGFLYCDGSAVSRATYSALFAKIGTTYGAGDGATTFNLPDGRGVAIIGVS